jgi:succinate dehydrogenase/fumarate reductase cytochrome b subunit
VAAHFNSDYCSSCLHSIAAVAFAFAFYMVIMVNVKRGASITAFVNC